MKDLIQEGRKIQETFKKNVVESDTLNEGFFYNLFSKITDKLEKLSSKSDALSDKGDKIVYAVGALALATTPFSLPIAIGIVMTAMAGVGGAIIAGESGEISRSMMKFFEKKLSDRQYNQNIKPILQRVFNEIAKNPEVKSLQTTLKELFNEKSNKQSPDIESKITAVGEKLDAIFNTALDKVMNLPEVKPLLLNIRADRDSFKGSDRGMGRYSPSTGASDSDVKSEIRSIIKNIVTMDQQEYYKIKSDSEELTESRKM